MNQDYSEYNDTERQVPWKKIGLTILAFVVLVVIILLLLRACQGKDLTKTLVQAGKDYYVKYPDHLPEEVGQCYTVDLKTLLQEGLLKEGQYSTCDTQNTYVKVCYLENKSYQYVGILDCEKQTSKFDIWKDGTIDSIVADKTDVRFRFLGQKLSLGTKYYYPGDKTNAADINEYYAAVPSPEYTGKEDEQAGYKWYTTKTVTEYYKNGAYTSTQPSGYPNKGESKMENRYSETRPEEVSYRSNVQETTLYRSKKMAYQYKWACFNNPQLTGAAIYSNTICAFRTDEYKHVGHADYTCDGVNSVDSSSICSDWSEWSSTSCKTSTLTGTTCESKTGYNYTDTMWKWYKSGSANYYYPSNTTDVNQEQTYYINQPVSGAIRDDNTKATVYKYYKVVKDDNSNNTNLEEWMDVTDGYVSGTDLISAFQTLGYDVYSLSDINAIDEIRYQYQMQYRNPEE